MFAIFVPPVSQSNLGNPQKFKKLFFLMAVSLRPYKQALYPPPPPLKDTANYKITLFFRETEPVILLLEYTRFQYVNINRLLGTRMN